MKKIKRLIILLLLVCGLLYLGTYHTYASTYNPNKTYTIWTDVNRPDTIEEIMEIIDLQADFKGQDVSNSIIYVDSSNYINEILNMPQPCMRKLGSYIITFEAFAPNGNSSTCQVIVNVEDREAPYILSIYTKNEISISLNEVNKFGLDFVEERILKNVRAYDDFDQFNLDYDTDTSSVLMKAGDYNATVTISDQSGNNISHTMTIHITDDIKPRFEIECDYIIAGVNDGYTIDNIIDRAAIVAFSSDNVDIEVHIRTDSLPSSFNTAGVYIIPVYATYQGLTSEFNFYLEIVDESAPSFSLDETVLTVTNRNLCTQNEIEAFIDLKAKSMNYTYEVLNDEYSENYDQNGEYEYEVLLTYEDGNEEVLHLTMRVIEDEEVKEVEIKKPNFFKKVWEFIKSLCIILFKIAIWPIEVLKTSK